MRRWENAEREKEMLEEFCVERERGWRGKTVIYLSVDVEKPVIVCFVQLFLVCSLSLLTFICFFALSLLLYTHTHTHHTLQDSGVYQTSELMADNFPWRVRLSAPKARHCCLLFFWPKTRLWAREPFLMGRFRRPIYFHPVLGQPR